MLRAVRAYLRRLAKDQAEDEADEKIERFLAGIRLLQVCPSHVMFAGAAKLFYTRWEAEWEEAAKYFARTWLHKNCACFQQAFDLPPTVPRHSCAIEGTNWALRRGQITPGPKITSLISDIIKSCEAYSTKAEALPSSTPSILPRKPSRKELVEAARWTLSSAAKNTFIDSDQQRYFVPTPHCVSICKGRRRLNDFVARFKEKLDDPDASWEDWTWDNYELAISCIHVVKRRGGQLTCSCYCGRKGNCKHALGLGLLEEAVPDISLADLLPLGEVNKGRAKHTKAKGLTPDADYVRRQLEIIRMAEGSSGIGSSPQFPRDALKLEPLRSVDLNKQYREMAAEQLEDIPDPTVQQTQPPMNPASPSYHVSEEVACDINATDGGMSKVTETTPPIRKRLRGGDRPDYNQMAKGRSVKIKRRSY
ncbi:hypothetical protein FOL46_009889 [Perkinsus olseni]|uniref:SWIM-type domain-containing protein n=1 Tax=Perkinsus olseni TaxID=32597 RepID=A0A7J6MJY8_PEROL|nr:hypothetical protein FOL46_009889 [Perkinsus olseni]